MADDNVDISGMPDPGTIGLSQQASPSAALPPPDPTANMPEPKDLFKKYYGFDAPTDLALSDFMSKGLSKETDYQPTAKSVVHQLGGLPRAAAGLATSTIGGGVSLATHAVGGAGGLIFGAMRPDLLPDMESQVNEKARDWSDKISKLGDYVPTGSAEGDKFASDLLGAPGNIIKEASDSTLGRVLPDNAYQAVKDVGRDVGTDAMTLGLPEMGRVGMRGVKAGVGAAKNFVKGEASSLTPPEPSSATDAVTPDVGAPVTGDQLRNQPNPIPPPEGTVAAAREEARGVPKTSPEAVTSAPTLPETDTAPQDMSLTKEQRAIVREGVAARRAAESPSETTQSPGDAQRGSVQIFRAPKDEGPQETPAPETVPIRQQHLDDLDKLSGGALPTRRTSALTGDYNATGNDWQAAKTGNEAAQRQLASENDALHAAVDNVHKSTGSLQPDSVDPTTLGNRGQIVRNAVQGIEDHFNKATDNIYDAARATSGKEPMPNFLGRASSFLADDANYMPDGFRRAAQARLQQLKTSGDAGIRGDGSDAAAPSSVGAAEKFREWLNANRTLDNMHTTKQLVNHTDTDVAEHGGPGLFRTARAQRTHQAQMLEEPAGIKKLLAPGDSQGINHAVPEHKVMDYVNGLDRVQHEHVMNVLRAGAHLSPELAELSAAAIREIQAHTVSRLHDAATNEGGKWNARDFYNATTQYARNAASTFKDRPDITKNLKTINDAGNTLHMDKSYPGAVGQAVRSGIVGAAVKGAGAVASSLAHEIPVVGRMVGRGIEGATEAAAGEAGKKAAEKAFEKRTVDRNGKQRGSVQLFNDNELNRKNEERTTFHGKDLNPRNERNERTANQQMGGNRPLTDEQNDVIGRLMGGKQRGAVGDLSQRDAITHKSAPAQEEGVTNHIYGVPDKGGGMLVKENPERGVSQVQTANVNDKGQGWGTRMLQRAADDAHARGQVLHSDKQVSEGQTGAYKNLSQLGYKVKMMDNDVRGGARHAVGDHVFEVRPPKGYEAPDELKNFIKKSAPAHKVDENGPANWEDLKARRNEKVMPVNPQGAEGSIYGDKANNIAFRAWHDKTHLDLNAGFDHDGELATAKEQLRQAKAAGLSEESQKALWADTYETFKHHEENGEFPKDPRQFVAQRMADKTPLGARIPKQRGAVGDLNAPTEEGNGSTLNVGLHQGTEGEPGFKKMSKQEAQKAVESTGAKVTKNTVLTPNQHGVSEPTSVMSTDRPLSHDDMQSVLAKTKQSAIPQRTDAGEESMHVAPGHEQTAKEQGWDKFNPDYFREHSGQTATDAKANPKNIHPNSRKKK